VTADRIAWTVPTRSIASVTFTISLYFMYAKDDIDLSRTLERELMR